METEKLGSEMTNHDNAALHAQFYLFYKSLPTLQNFSKWVFQHH